MTTASPSTTTTGAPNSTPTTTKPKSTTTTTAAPTTTTTTTVVPAAATWVEIGRFAWWNEFHIDTRPVTLQSGHVRLRVFHDGQEWLHDPLGPQPPSYIAEVWLEEPVANPAEGGPGCASATLYSNQPAPYYQDCPDVVQAERHVAPGQWNLRAFFNSGGSGSYEGWSLVVEEYR